MLHPPGKCANVGAFSSPRLRAIATRTSPLRFEKGTPFNRHNRLQAPRLRACRALPISRANSRVLTVPRAQTRRMSAIHWAARPDSDSVTRGERPEAAPSARSTCGQKPAPVKTAVRGMVSASLPGKRTSPLRTSAFPIAAFTARSFFPARTHLRLARSSKDDYPHTPPLI
jgi:hypothetical protein